MIIVFIDGGTIETTYNTKITRIDINEYYNGNTTNNIFYNKDYAFKIAKERKLKIRHALANGDIEYYITFRIRCIKSSAKKKNIPFVFKAD